MIIYDNEYKTKENKNWTKDKIEPQYLFSECATKLYRWFVFRVDLWLKALTLEPSSPKSI